MSSTSQSDLCSSTDYSGTVRVVPKVHRFAAYAVQKARPLMMLLMAAVACVLLIACANVANLLLARGSYRSHEMAIRSAIGAARPRLLRQCLVESLLLSLVGAGAGFASGSPAGGWSAQAFGPADVPRLQEVAVDPSALLFTVVLSLLTTLLFGFVPAWRLSHASPQDCLKESPRAGGARATHRLQNFVAVAEIAVALVLLVGGGLLLRSFVRVLNVPLGFRPEGTFIVRTLFDRARYPDPVKREVVQKELIDRLAHLQGVQVVAGASHLPLSDTRQIGFRLEHAAPDDFHWAENSLVSPGYFPAMGISILRGRDFTEQDRRDTPLVAVINETLARQYFPGRDPIGQRFHWGGRDLFTIVGIVGDVHISALDRDPPPMIYNSMFQVQSGASERTALILRLDPGRQHDQNLFERGPATGLVARSGPSYLQLRDPRNTDFRVGGAAPLHYSPDPVIRADRPGPGTDRSVRCDVVPGRATPAGTGDPHGAWSRPGGSVLDGHETRRRTRDGRLRHRIGAVSPGWTADSGNALPDQRLRSSDAALGRGAALWRCTSFQLHSRTPGDEGRSHGGAEVRMKSSVVSRQLSVFNCQLGEEEVACG